MPIYAYRCAACGHARDVLRKLSDPALTVCPACGADQFEKQVTAAGFQLKGSGWYATDFRNNGAAKPAAEGQDAAGKEGAAATPAADAGSASDTGSTAKTGSGASSESGSSSSGTPPASSPPASSPPAASSGGSGAGPSSH